ncbi:hypothetical protein [Anaeromyxobacter oryzae]|uniref:Uncharacterized protein n=1 Tax=Anaeromyxobacter oryzae TaxID=2918170 RepID=A0ABN6MSG1_9BACT|nr:hypothetical protein [Anaeromyxobacter oryzae]BDG02703.1 hypothetical protein AMOR_16990 [Anaeromyxobacter oryzae]
MSHKVVLAFLLAAAAPARAVTSVVLLPATGANVHEGHLTAATDVLRAHLERTGKLAVTVAPVPGGLRAEPSPLEAAQAARAGGAELAVTLRIARLGNVASVRLAAYRQDGSAAHVDELGAAGPDDLDAALRRLAAGLAEGRPAHALAEIDTVTEREADPYLKYVATNVFGIRLGSAFLMNRASPAGTSHSAAGGGVFWLYDARSFLADLSFDLYGGDADRLVALGIGFYRPFSKGNVSPYLGGGVAYHWLQTGGDGAAGLAFRAAGGVLVGRLSTVQVRVEAGWQVSAFTEKVHEASPVTPHGPFATVGLGY